MKTLIFKTQSNHNFDNTPPILFNEYQIEATNAPTGVLSENGFRWNPYYFKSEKLIPYAFHGNFIIKTDESYWLFENSGVIRLNKDGDEYSISIGKCSIIL